ncbi:MAG TPA: NUDIX hydrolase [Verrucomicrobiae bacterium]|nr:NUDIX hydrolase [Verrucomicrobiae bacterium]
MIQPWKKLGSKPIGNFGIFTIRSDRKVSPRTGKEHNFFVIDSVNWVNVIALTPDGQIILVEQYRHGSNTVELEIPGGMMDSRDATPEATGARELREETGYEGDMGIVIGQVYPNPAIMANVCFTVLIQNCRCIHPVEFDHGEDIMTRLVPVSKVTSLLRTGTIRHALVVAALYHFELHQRGAAEPGK